MLILLSLLAIALGQECSDADNGESDNLNPGCNLAGTCVDGDCFCCELDPVTLLPTTFGGVPDCPDWIGGKYTSTSDGTCVQQTEFASVTFKYYFPQSQNYDCNDSTENDNLVTAINEYYGDMAYDGVIVMLDCRECSISSPCRFYDIENSNKFTDHTDGVEFEIGTDLHTFYNENCFVPTNPVPSIYDQDRCKEDYDQGYLSYWAFKRAKYYNPSEPNAWNSDGTSDFRAVNEELGLGMTESSFTVILNNKKVSIRTRPPTLAPSPIPTTLDPTPAPTPTPTLFPTLNPTAMPSPIPTPTPTFNPSLPPSPAPTATPSIGDTCFQKGYTNQLEDLKYMGNGDNCRAGISAAWPGGQTCKSPYIVCLPEENTPNQSPKNPFYDDTHQYTVDQCIYECAWDQRCRGFEFVPTTGSLGECNLIDDLPLEITNQGSYIYSDTDADLTGNGALCWQKESYCNPFFEAEDLEQTMIDCYCPNNRKGFYTKKVKRTVANTKFCGSDADATQRIKQAQANRMFHLCENWCLFNTFQPELESWYWNPWKTCWRKQYAGVGTHRSYCNRVIRNPDTIEQYFINYRTANFCTPMTQVPTKQPSDFKTKWYLAQEEESCTEACASRAGAACSEAETASIGETTPEQDVKDAFQEAGITCTVVDVAPIHYAAPVLNAMNGKCLTRHSGTEANTGCQWATGVGYQRLCACTED